jgi:hypothetical protein
MVLEETFVALPTLPQDTTLLGMTYFNESHGSIRGYTAIFIIRKTQANKDELICEVYI